MKTFLGITTGLLVGFIAGVTGIIWVAIEDKGFRKYINEQADEL